jgi:hypothetical protein
MLSPPSHPVQVASPRLPATQRRGVLDWIADHKLLVFGLGLGIVAVLVYTQRKRFSMAFDFAKANAFKLLLNTLPGYGSAAKYADIILEESEATNRAPLWFVSPITTLQLGMRESRWGDALSPPGPGGTGDGGHGRGLMQVDDRSNADWLAANDWRDPRTNVRRGLEILQAKMSFLAGRSNVPGLASNGIITIGSKAAAARGVQPGNYQDPRPLSGDALLNAAIAAYNTGEGNVLMSLAAGVPVDTTTAGSEASGGKGDYSSDVLARAAAFAQKLTEVA